MYSKSDMRNNISKIYTNNINNYKIHKRIRGKSLIELPRCYIIIDLETTGLSFNYDHIIEIGMLKIENDRIIDMYESLIQPNNFYGNGYLDPSITSLTGITDEILMDAPLFYEVSNDIINFIGHSIIVSHNVHFDINFLYDYLLRYNNHTLSNDCWDLLRRSRAVLPDLENHKLITVANFFDYEYIPHRSLSDCQSTLEMINRLKGYLYDNNIKLINLFKSKKCKPKFDLRTLKSENPIDNNQDCVFYNKYICFTGKLEAFTRKEAAQISVNLGAYAQNQVTKKTDFLILGDFDYVSNIKKGKKSSKLRKAEQYKEKGQEINIINESTFIQLIDE